MRNCTRLALTLIFCASFAAFGQSRSSEEVTAPVITFADKSVTASGFSPDSPIVFFGVGLVPTGYESSVYKWSSSVVADHDGKSALASDIAIPCKSVWVAVSTRDARYAIAAPPGCSLRIVPAAPRPLHRSSGGGIDLFVHGRASVDLLYVHPGTGAWTGFAYDGVPGSDGDGLPNGVATIGLHDLKPLDGTAAAPAAFVAGGVLFAIDYHRLDISVVRVDGAMLENAQ